MIASLKDRTALGRGPDAAPVIEPAPAQPAPAQPAPAQPAPVQPAPLPAGRWIEAVSHLDPKFGGVSAVVPQMSDQLRRDGVGIEIASFSASDERQALAAYPELASRHWPASRGAWLRSASLRAELRQQMMQADGVHIHGLWETQSLVAARLARSLGKPYIVSAHGMLEQWALAHKRLKKQIYSAVLERSHIEHADCLHALTPAEAEDYRRFGSRRPIAVIPNGIALPATVNSSLVLERFPALRDKRMILFLGRLHAKKGLDILVRAWADIAVRYPDAVLVLAGPDAPGADSTRSSLAAIIAQAGISDRVVFTGMLGPELKWSALSQAHCFVLPSYSEGLSVAVLEALGMGVPVIVSDRCNLPEVQQAGAGWQISATEPDLRRALEEMLSHSAARNAEMGGHGRRLVHDRFRWQVTGGQMAELYRWVLGGARPRSFELLEVTV